MLTEFYFGWESALIILLQSVLSPMVWMLSFFSEFGEELILFPLLGMLYWGYDKKLGEKVGVNLLISIVMCPMLKNLFIRLRPYFVIPEIRCLKPVESGDIYDVTLQGYSFPSGHAASAASVYGTIARGSSRRTVRTVCIILIAAVGVSRFCLGVHYPTDVLAGLAIGLGAVFLNELLSRCVSRKVMYLSVIAVCSSGFFFCTTTDYYTGYGVLAGGLLGLLYEQKSVGFENTDSFPKALSRTVGGIIAFVAMNLLIKWAAGLIPTGDGMSMFIRTLRYGIVSFVCIGVYPHVFRYEKT